MKTFSLSMMLLTLASTSSIAGFAATVSSQEATQIASEFFASMSNTTSAPVLTATAGSASNPLYYIFNAPAGKGFVIVSADDTTPAILGYSTESNYNINALPEPMQWVMAGIEKEIKVAPGLQHSTGATVRRSQARRAGAAAEAKLLETPNWSQEAPFNNMIPGNRLVGCVGTAMATVMKYYNWPEQGTGSFGDTDFNTVYDWNSMRSDNYRSGYSATEGEAVATLMYHAATSIATEYGMSGSSAYEVRVPGALSTHFGYDPGVSYKKRSEVASQQEWDQMVKNEIDAGRPVIYCGQDVSAGHAFVCDGYQGDYLHFNWGWGGSANGFFLSTALNPTVSRTHHYNNLNTIVYNIKPAADAARQWSDLHITADANQPGIGSDMTQLEPGKHFTLRVGNIKNLAFTDFSGQAAVALFSASGEFKGLLSTPTRLSLRSMETLPNGYIDFKNCTLPDGIDVEDSDVVCVATCANGADWLQVPGELNTVNHLNPMRAEAESFAISLPSGIEGVEIEGADSVIRGWNYTFTVKPLNPSENVITVKANGFLLLPDNANRYTIANVKGNQEIQVIVQNAADVLEKRSLWVGTPGTLSEMLTEAEAGTVKDLTIYGHLDARDFQYMRSAMKLNRLDISAVSISGYGTDQANALPREAFCQVWTLKEVVLPNSINRMNNGCFRQCGITSIVIPANVKTYEYNVFAAATALRDIWVGRETAEFINWCVLSGVKTAECTLHVPSERAKSNYSAKEYWKDIANIVVETAPAATDFGFAVMEDANVNFDCNVAPGRYETPQDVRFKAAFNADTDDRMDVYANSTRLTPDAEGFYNTTVSASTIIHFDRVAPTEIASSPSFWTLTAANGSVGLLSDVVNVLPGEDFVIRANALNIPANLDQLYWAAALTDAKGNIKEFISPISLWTAGPGNNFKMNVNCCVREASVREGNQIRLVTSVNKKSWNLVEGADDEITAALPAVNNTNPVYNINIPAVANATVSGAIDQAVRGRDFTLKVVPVKNHDCVDIIVNGDSIITSASSVSHTFVAMEDMDFEINVYTPKSALEVVYNVQGGELYNAVTPTTIKPYVKVVGEVLATDLNTAFNQNFVQKTVTHLDLSGVKIRAAGNYADNTIPSEMFYKSSGIGQTVPVLEEVILPNTVTMIADAAFKNCANLREITLPESMSSQRVQVGTYASGSPKYAFPLGDMVFDGCNALTTIRIQAPLTTYNGKKVASHFNPFCHVASNTYYYFLGVPDPKKVTVVVPAEDLSVYLTKNTDSSYGNPWLGQGYNLVSEYPVYGVGYDEARVKNVDSSFDPDNAVSFLGNNVSVASETISGKLYLTEPEKPCLVYDNGELVENIGADGEISVTFHNPNTRNGLNGNHRIEVVYVRDVDFALASPSFSISEIHATAAGAPVEPVLEQVSDNSVVYRNVAENSDVLFRVAMDATHEDDLETRVKCGDSLMTPDEDGWYHLTAANAGKQVSVFAVPLEGATLSEAELASIDTDEAAALTTLALEGDIDPELLASTLKSLSSLEELDLSEVTSELAEGAFDGCASLRSVTLPDVTEIKANTFRNCSSLETIFIPSSVTVIGEGAFSGCENLTSLTITSPESIGAKAFEGCSSLTTLSINAAAAAPAAEAPKAMRRRSASAENAFEGLNPNCFIYLDQNVAAPAAVGNYITTGLTTVTDTDEEGNVSEREERVYFAEGPISLQAGHILNIDRKFTIGEEGSISLSYGAEMSEGKLTGIVVPFTPAESLSCLSLEKDAANFEVTEGIKANTPCLIASSLLDEGLVFTAGPGATVDPTPSDIEVAGSEITLHATYAPKSMAAEGIYFLNESGKAFELAVPFETLSDDEEKPMVNVGAFGVYASSEWGLPEIPVDVDALISTGLINLDSEAVNGLRVENGSLSIYSDSVRDITVYGIDGRAAARYTLSEGWNSLPELPAGLYIIDGHKVAF